MDASAILKILGGLGLFLLGIHHLTDGLKSLAGDSLRRVLQKFVAGRFSAVVSGVIFTAAVQSSTAATLTVVGFVSAGLVTLEQAIGVIIGATLGTTTTPWMVAFFGFRIRIADYALPLLGVGALLWLVAKGKLRSLGAILAGFGLLFTGIQYLQDGMAGITWNLDAFAGMGAGGLWILAGIGILMTVVMQSSSAAAATTLVALDAGSLNLDQACAMVVGQAVGSAATTALVVIGGSLVVKRTALAHIVFSATIGVLGLLFLGPLVSAAQWVGAKLDDSDGVMALAAFSTLYKLAGIAVFFPWLDQYARLIVRMTGSGSDRKSAVDRLEPIVAQAGGAAALEAAWRATLEVARDAVDAVRRRLAGESVAYDPPVQSVQQIERFLESLSLETTDTASIAPRLVRLTHALDHLTELHDDLARTPPAGGDWSPPDSFETGARALAAWLDATKDPAVPPAQAILKAVEDASQRLTDERKAGRDKILEDIALQRTPAATGRAAIDALAWTDTTLHHASRLGESLSIASGM